MIDKNTMLDGFAKQTLESDDAEAFYQLTQMSIFKKFMGHLITKADAMGTVMLRLDLSTDEGHKRALRYQGEASGLTLAVETAADFLVENLAMDLDPEEKENENIQPDA